VKRRRLQAKRWRSQVRRRRL